MTEHPIQNIDIGKQARIWGMLCHLTALLGLVGVPFGHILGPLIVWLFKKKEYPFVDAQGREAINFQLSMTLYAFVAALLIYLKLGMIFLFALATANFILIVTASVRAYGGDTFRYPFKIRFFK